MDCWCECHRSEYAVTSSRCRGCHVDIELSSLGRLENVVSVLVRRLHEEIDSLVTNEVTFRLNLRRRKRRQLKVSLASQLPAAVIDDPGRGCGDAGRRNVEEPFLLSHFTVESSVQADVRSYAAAPSIDDEDSSSSSSTNECDDGVTDCVAGDTNAMARRRHMMRYIWPSRQPSLSAVDDGNGYSDDDDQTMLLLRQVLFADKQLDDDDDASTATTASWFLNRADRLFDEMFNYHMSRDRAERRHLNTLRQLFVIATVESPAAGADRWLELHIVLFLQWFRLMSVLPVTYDPEVMNFMLLSTRNVIRIYACDYAYYQAVWNRADVWSRPTTAASRTKRGGFTNAISTDTPSPMALANSDDETAVSDNVVKSPHSPPYCDTRMMISASEPTPFHVTDGVNVIRPDSRPTQAMVEVIARKSPTDEALTDSSSFSSSSSSRSRKSRRRIDNDDDLIEPFLYCRGAAPATTTMTLEQQRVLSVVEHVLGISPPQPTSTDARDRDATPSTKRARTTRQCRDEISERIRALDAWDAKRFAAATSESRGRVTADRWPIGTIATMAESSTDRRILIDGVAGAGKTFLLGVLLERFARVRYLVKKRSFVEATLKRFNHHDRLDAQTIDSFLMRHLGIRSLPLWLGKRQDDLADLKQQLLRRPLPADDDELVFVDEYSLVEQSLAELLEHALVHRRVVLVGDCNQLAAIGDSVDQPVRTLLAYRHICFMYDNVRTKDSRLLQRLSNFNARTEDMRFRAISGLPARRCVDMSEYFAAVAAEATRRWRSPKSTNDAAATSSALLPRVIVRSNEVVNYLNWAICYLIVHNLKRRGNGRASQRQYLRYRRKIVMRPDALEELAAAEDRAKEWLARRNDGVYHIDFLDDAYADEHFVIVGLRYRMIAAQESWPAQIGSRVIVTKILDEQSVQLVTDDDRAVPFVVHKTRVRPYEFHSRWNTYTATAAADNAPRLSRGGDRVHLYMFPFVMDAATTVYQVQGLTLDTINYARCYIDVRAMDVNTLYVTLSRFQQESQIHGVANCQTLCD